VGDGEAAASVGAGNGVGEGSDWANGVGLGAGIDDSAGEEAASVAVAVAGSSVCADVPQAANKINRGNIRKIFMRSSLEKGIADNSDSI
jgi:hypothetical protein